MRIFVASWFFPPSTSSEGIVGFKLLSHSSHQYDVCSSLSDQWGYKAHLELAADNIRSLPVSTDDVEEWVRYAVGVFEREHAKVPYDCVMTRSMPPESIKVGIAIKEKHPDIPWIASLADPISRVPHMIRDLLDRNKTLTKKEKSNLKTMLNLPKKCSGFDGRGDAGIRTLCEYKDMEVDAIRNADALIFPNGAEANYVLCGLQRRNVFVIPHSFDAVLLRNSANDDSGEATGLRRVDSRKELVYLGYSSQERSLVPIVEAAHYLQLWNPQALSNIKIRFIGNIVDDSASLIFNYCLNDCISIEPSVSYLDSLAIMEKADWLIHVDGYFKAFGATGGSVYFAGKLADYLGTQKPILAITGANSPAMRITSQAGGVVVDAWNTKGLACILEEISNGTACNQIAIDSHYRQRFNAVHVGSMLDEAIDSLLTGVRLPENLPDRSSCDDKILSICVPSYNVEAYLNRCLLSLVSCNDAQYLEVIVVNDGSSDKTHDLAMLWKKKYPGIIEVIDKQNGGHGSTINEALSYAKGRYFRVVDADDWLSPNALSDLIESLLHLSGDVDVISSDYCQIDCGNGGINPIRKKNSRIAYGTVYKLKDLDLSKEYLSIHSLTYRRQLLVDSGMRLREHAFYVDVQYQLQPLIKAESILFTPGRLYHYSVGNSEQSISHFSFVERYENHTAVVKDAIEMYYTNKDNMSQSLDDYFYNIITRYLLATQYSISLVYDNDRVRGMGRARAFDDYLKTKHYDAMYADAGKRYSTLSLVRKKNYDADSVPIFKNLHYKQISKQKKVARKLTKKILSGGIGDVVASEIKRRK